MEKGGEGGRRGERGRGRGELFILYWCLISACLLLLLAINSYETLRRQLESVEAQAKASSVALEDQVRSAKAATAHVQAR